LEYRKRMPDSCEISLNRIVGEGITNVSVAEACRNSERLLVWSLPQPVTSNSSADVKLSPETPILPTTFAGVAMQACAVVEGGDMH